MNIIELAKEAGFDIDEGLFPFEASEDKFIGTERTLEAFAALVRAEREWVDLTREDMQQIAKDTLGQCNQDVYNAVIAAFKEKNK
jgi:FMN phosphatase YigB (HAD superfamily)